MKINFILKKYIEENIFPSYQKNDEGHNLEHIRYVIDRSLKFASTLDDINIDMVYTIAAYHDIGHYIDAKHHEKVSSEILLADRNLREFFNDEEIQVMADAVYDHRASMKGEPRTIYGKIVSSADRNVSLDSMIRRTYLYRITHNPDDTLEQIIEDSRQHIMDKFGSKGYASEKMYFEDLDYLVFLEQVKEITSDPIAFRDIYMKVNGLTSLIQNVRDEDREKTYTKENNK